jgi:hypothetical protein
MEVYEKMDEILTENSKCLVGIILKRLEVLEEERGLSIEQYKSLFKNLTKEIIYENSRYLKKLIKAELTTGSIIFNKPRE